MLAPILDVFVGNAFIIDWDVFQLWLDGFDCETAAESLHRSLTAQSGSDKPATFGYSASGDIPTVAGGLAALCTVDLMYADVCHQYRDLEALERLLPTPNQLVEQRVLQIPAEECAQAIEMFYGLDDVVIRELIGRKPSSKLRKDLDDVSEKTSVHLKSCRRQFDNIRRVYKTLDDMPGDIVSNIRSHFLLSERLARRYAVVVLFALVRFEVHKRRLGHLTFGDLYVCGDLLLRHWCDEQGEVDREFLQQLRDLKPLLDRDKEARSVVLKKLAASELSTEARGDVQQNFRSFFRNLVNIAVNLNHTRDLKDLFIDIQEKLVEPCKASRWTSDDMKHCLAALNFQRTDLETFNRDYDCWLLWQQFMRVVGVSLQQLFDR